MWICLNNGFLSALEDRNDFEYLYVRARVREHLKDNFPDHDIIESFDSDYQFRIRIPKYDFGKIIFDKINDITYDNFKDSVQDEDLKLAYGQIWMVMLMMQEYWR